MHEIQRIKRKRAKKKMALTVLYTLIKYLGIMAVFAGFVALIVSACAIDSEGEAGNIAFALLIASVLTVAIGKGLYMLSRMIWAVTD